MSIAVAYPTARAGRENFRELLDAAGNGLPASVVRDSRTVAAVDGERFLAFLMATSTAQVTAVNENDGWSLFFPGLPIAADGNTFDEACDELIVALRDYAEAWVERLRIAPNHADNWGLVQLIALASDAQLRNWITR